ncbi:MAG: Esterase [Actinomycetia bacterium]|nr:Esterase [Actinomycetes bacterium]
MRLRRLLVPAVAVVALVASTTMGLPASATVAPLKTPTGVLYHRITFPVAGAVNYTDDFGACRQGCTRRHEGNDLLGSKLMHEVAANDGVITFVHEDNSGLAGNMLALRDTDGWTYYYIHINNDTPGTDDGANPAQWRFAPGIKAGSHVKAGQFIAYMGDSGDAETTQPHLHFELHLPDGTPIDPYTSLKLAQGIAVNGVCGIGSNPRAHANSAAGKGYWIITDDGVVRTYGTAQTYAAHPTTPVIWTWPVVAMAPTPSGSGYWLTDNEGHVVAFGDAHSYGGAGNINLAAPIIGMTATVTGKGYWLLARDGGIFSFGDATFFGSMGTKKLNAPIVGMAATPGGKGYWLLGRDGGIFSFGNAHFWGSTGAMTLAKPVLSMAATASGRGYWLIGGDGGIFTFGDAAYRGSLPGTGRCNTQAVSMAGTKTGLGYWVLEPNGKVDAFGDATNYGSANGVFPLGLVAVPS